ncbi:uncharacterized protein [Haliotis asinina]|uniref:uncharacterized protein n=1 Tax=Haliotis asinina TaxID=109174 RepID=UPI0035320C9B
MAGVTIRRLVCRSDVKHVAELAKQEGWSISLPYLLKCFDIDHSNWWVAEEKDGRIVGNSKTFFQEDNATCQGGMFVLDKKYRGQGIGGKLKSAVLAEVQEKNVFVTALKPELNLNVFKPLQQIHSMTITKSNQKLSPLPRTEFRILPLADAPLELVEKYDARTYPIKRTTIFHRCIIGEAACVLVAVKPSSGDVIGYAALKETWKGWMFCPTYADNDDVGYELTRKMFDHVPKGADIEVNPFTENQATINLYNEIGFSFQNTPTVMYSKKPLIIPTKKVYSTAGSDYSPM